MTARRIALTAAIVGLGLAFARSATAAPTVEEAKVTVELFKKTDPGLTSHFANAAGYAVFPSVGKGAVGIGGAHGKGIVFERGKAIGETTLSQISVGAQLGGEEYSEVIFFQTPEALTKFKNGNFEFSADASAVALKSGASANAKYDKGVAVVTSTKGGLMLQAAIGGQKFSFKPFAPTG